MSSTKNKKTPPINYTSREFDSIKNDLIEHAKRYYPNTYKDFSDTSFGSLMLDSVAYIGDILSFYLDYQANESFLNSAVEYDNVLRLARQLGYKMQQHRSATGILTIYAVVPALSNGQGPDPDYVPIFRRGSQFGSSTGNMFLLNEDVNFSNSNYEVVVADVDVATGNPLSYAIKGYGQIVSGRYMVDTVDIDDFKRFLKVLVGKGSQIIEIISVYDSDGQEYFEVEHMAQDVIYKQIINRTDNSDTAPYILKPMVVPRRFTVEHTARQTYIQFGLGSESQINQPSIADPSNVVLQMHGKDYITDSTFDPTKLTNSDKFGIVPANTTLTIVYRQNTTDNANSAVGTVTKASSVLVRFPEGATDPILRAYVVDNVETTNEEPIIGDVSLPTRDEVKELALGSFATQGRAVTRQDYINMIYRMPARFGNVKRCNVIQDPDSTRRNLNMYVISEDADGSLVTTNGSIKQNIKTWINKHKMINDTVDILDVKIINLGIEFDIVADSDKNKHDVLSLAMENVKEEFLENKLDIGEPLFLTDIYTILNSTFGIIDVLRVNIVNKNGGIYSDMFFDVRQNLSADGRYVACPQDMIFEIKFPDADIKGSIK